MRARRRAEGERRRAARPGRHGLLLLGGRRNTVEDNAISALACAAAAVAGAPQRTTVAVLDNYFLPAKLTVNKGSRVAWKVRSR